MPATWVSIRLWAMRRELTGAQAFQRYLEGDCPKNVGRTDSSRIIGIGRWAELNGVTIRQARMAERWGRLPPNVQGKDRKLLPSGKDWWDDPQEWARLADSVRREGEKYAMAWSKFSRKRRGWIAEARRLQARLTAMRKEILVTTIALKARQRWLTAINRRVREGLKAKERGELFLAGEHAKLLAMQRKEEETRRKKSIGRRRFNAIAKTQASMLVTKHEVTPEVLEDGESHDRGRAERPLDETSANQQPTETVLGTNRDIPDLHTER
jgi:hypothetical protein